MWALQKVRPHVAFISLFLRWCYNHKFWKLLKEKVAYLSTIHSCVFHKIHTHSIVEITVFLYHTIDLTQNQDMPIQADGPSPLCSCLIYDPFRRYEVSQIFNGTPCISWIFLEGKIQTFFPLKQWHKAHRVWHHDELHLVKNIEYRFYQISGRSWILYFFSAMETSQLHVGTLWIRTYFHKHYR